ncbi:MAG: hypothetical protein IRZ11_01865 [Clostridia bacterium]|nr:hypothetical protein [Clostridia bacterium]
MSPSAEPAAEPAWTDEEVLVLARAEGHELANLVQVVDGWLQLGDLAEARAALAQAARRAGLGRAVAHLPAPLAAELVFAAARSSLQGVEFTLELSGDAALRLASLDRRALRRLLAALAEAAAEAEAPFVRLVAPSSGEEGLEAEVAVPARGLPLSALVGRLAGLGLDVRALPAAEPGVARVSARPARG